MQEPIRKGERYLSIGFDGGGEMIVVEAINDGELTGFGSSLRLPSRFQPSSDKKECGKCQGYCCSCCLNNQPPPTPIWACKKDRGVSCQHKECKPAASGKCGCGCHNNIGSQDHWQDSCPCRKSDAPDPAIEAKIKELLKEIGHGPLYYEKALRDLVELARRSDR